MSDFKEGGVYATYEHTHIFKKNLGGGLWGCIYRNCSATEQIVED